MALLKDSMAFRDAQSSLRLKLLLIFTVFIFLETDAQAPEGFAENPDTTSMQTYLHCFTIPGTDPPVWSKTELLDAGSPERSSDTSLSYQLEDGTQISLDLLPDSVWQYVQDRGGSLRISGKCKFEVATRTKKGRVESYRFVPVGNWEYFNGMIGLKGQYEDGKRSGMWEEHRYFSLRPETPADQKPASLYVKGGDLLMLYARHYYTAGKTDSIVHCFGKTDAKVRQLIARGDWIKFTRKEARQEGSYILFRSTPGLINDGFVLLKDGNIDLRKPDALATQHDFPQIWYYNHFNNVIFLGNFVHDVIFVSEEYLILQ